MFGVCVRVHGQRDKHLYRTSRFIQSFNLNSSGVLFLNFFSFIFPFLSAVRPSERLWCACTICTRNNLVAYTNATSERECESKNERNRSLEIRVAIENGTHSNAKRKTEREISDWNTKTNTMLASRVKLICAVRVQTHISRSIGCEGLEKTICSLLLATSAILIAFFPYHSCKKRRISRQPFDE